MRMRHDVLMSRELCALCEGKNKDTYGLSRYATV